MKPKWEISHYSCKHCHSIIDARDISEKVKHPISTSAQKIKIGYCYKCNIQDEVEIMYKMEEDFL